MAKNSQPSENVLLNFAHFNKILPAIIHDDQAPVVYKLDSPIHRINHYPAVDKYWGGGGTHITRDMCFPGGEHISIGIYVSQVGKHISLGKCASS